MVVVGTVRPSRRRRRLQRSGLAPDWGRHADDDGGGREVEVVEVIRYVSGTSRRLFDVRAIAAPQPRRLDATTRQQRTQHLHPPTHTHTRHDIRIEIVDETLE